ncbi:alkylation response protein AidB-like acyl-CoA dehydrogenase [Hamadaea flava]|uniref:Acyl-CoA dehydrogenase family protein n=1 Tax=Hamadaea flava TaxID=1742688 RepID=A0ABV8LHK4_9ACTN|nr:acyl-CoA dehydrogenase family protein [Hamadaea flava]MCP2324260.1 alkylation response protein AidB-like acyl-CoA dehydrogenase [Hamadaea flava]
MNANGTQSLSARVREFIDHRVIPVEHAVETDPQILVKLRRAAREAGVFAPSAPTEYGGLGLSMLGQTDVLEEAGRSLPGPLVLNCAAPDEGNMTLLEHVATPAQREQYLRPLAAGDVRSAFAMTEPAPGAGSDPTALATSAVRDGDDWVIDGQKWFITGADGAGFFIVMARTGADAATMFLVDAGNPGLTVGRHIPTIDAGFTGGHCEVTLERCRVRSSAVLGEVDRGFANAQVRLGPARLTHCMRWLGVARRAHEIMLGYVVDRELFGSRLADLGLAQHLIADNEIDLAASRALIRTAAVALDQGSRANQETSIAKTFVSEAVGRVVDRSVQLCGAQGVSHDLPLARFLAEVRPFRIYDGASEAHRWAVARRAVRRYEAARPGKRSHD